MYICVHDLANAKNILRVALQSNLLVLKSREMKKKKARTVLTHSLPFNRTSKLSRLDFNLNLKLLMLTFFMAMRRTQKQGSTKMLATANILPVR